MTFFNRQYRNLLLTAATISALVFLGASGASAQSNVMFNKLNRKTAPAAEDSAARAREEQRNTRVYRANANRRGALGGGYGLSLLSFSSQKTSASRNERFTVSTHVMALRTGGFPGGQAGAALIDNNGDIAAVIGTLNVNAIGALGWQFGGTQTLACAVPNNVSPGRYRLRLMFKTADGEWRVATLSEPNVPNSIDFEVM